MVWEQSSSSFEQSLTTFLTLLVATYTGVYVCVYVCVCVCVGGDMEWEGVRGQGEGESMERMVMRRSSC